MSHQIRAALCSLIILVAACDNDPTIVDSCGDGVVDPGEACDSGTGGATCTSLGFYHHSGVLTCTARCDFDVSNCGGTCGDGVVHASEGEQCDQTNLNGQDCVSRGFSGGPLGCDSSCLFNVSQCVSTCGNAIREAGENCDDGNGRDGDGCSQSCRVEAGWTCDEASPNVCTVVCGDGLIVHEEQCDGVNLDEQSCQSLGWYDGELACTAACTIDLSSCEAEGRCGDGIIQGSHDEVCDGDELDGRSCASLGQWSGQLLCDACAALDESGCVRLSRIAAGYQGTCALDTAGAAWCWGSNNYGQLGDGTTTGSRNPLRVVVPAGVLFSSIAVGWHHTCALDTAGAAWCWGRGAEGRLGTGTLDDRPTPTAVVMPTNRSFTAITCGNEHTCAIDDLGNGWCWGVGTNGRLGTGAFSSQLAPAAVTMPGTSPFIQISGGGSFTCALNLNQKAYCWGDNYFGQLGNDSTTDSNTPVLVSMGTDSYTSIGTGSSHACARRTTQGRVLCWGLNWFGQLGDGTNTNRSVPTLTTLVSGVQFITVHVGNRHSCARNTAGAAWCWGDGVQGQLGTGESSLQNTPQAVVMPAGVTFPTLSAGNSHSCALDATGKAWCWGEGDDGRTGFGTINDTNAPTAVLPPSP